jgi:tetratricopeptide (TPR) repeat protein
VARRYLADPTRFPDHVAFYTDLETRWQLAVRFAPGPAAGPEVLIYRNPDRASRRPDDLLDPDLYRKLGRFSTDYDRQFLGQMGSLFGRKGWYAKARDVCTWQLRVDPQNPVDALTRLGYFDYMRRNYEGAIDAWELAVGADSAEAKVHANLGAAYYRTGDTPRAVAILEKGLRDVPDDPEIPRNLAAIYWELKGPRASVEVLERVLPRFSVNAEFHETLAASHVALGDTTEGIQYYEEAIRLAPGREDLKARLEAICPSP